MKILRTKTYNKMVKEMNFLRTMIIALEEDYGKLASANEELVINSTKLKKSNDYQSRKINKLKGEK